MGGHRGQGQGRDVLKLIRDLLPRDVQYTDHALGQMRERRIMSPEVEYVLRTGSRDVHHDEFNHRRDTWKYAVTGQTLDGDRNLRIIVSLCPVPPLPEDEYVLVITAIELHN